MSRPLFDLALAPPQRGSRDVLGGLHRQLRAAILDGRLTPGLRLPATRVLAELAGVSRSTATAAYELLLAEGYVHARHGSGTFVATVVHQDVRKSVEANSNAAVSLEHKLVARWREAASAFPPVAASARFDLRPGTPDWRSFPFDIWRRLIARGWRTFEKTNAAAPDPRGEQHLREAIVQHVSSTRAVACNVDDIVVTAGAQQAFELLARALITPGKTVVAVENPGYPPVRMAFEAAGGRIHGVEVDREGLRVDKLPRRVGVIGVSPSHQFPLGVTMSTERRAALLAKARSADALVIEDDYDGEFRLGGRPLDALQTLDRDQRVFFVGTFSKSVFPAVRIGFIVAPRWAVEALVAAKRACNWVVPVPTQDALAAFIAEGHLARHVRKMRGIYADRQDAMLSALHQYFGDRLTTIPPLAGLHLCAGIAGQIDEQLWRERAAAASIRLSMLSQYSMPPASANGLILGYGRIATEDIKPAIRTLEAALRLRQNASSN